MTYRAIPHRISRFRDGHWPWLVAGAGALLLRWPLLILPAPGRDEAAYHYWSTNPEPAYAVLLQALLWFADILPLPSLVTLRLPSVLAGLLVLYLFDRLLLYRNLDPRQRLFALLALALTPWQTYTGSIVHPDNLKLAALLAFVLAVVHKRPWLAALAAGLAVLAKPSGLLVLAVGIIFFAVEHLRHGSLPDRRHALLAVAIAAPAIVTLQPAMIGAISEYGRLDPELGFAQTITFSIMPAVLFGGPLLLLAAAYGLYHYAVERKATGSFGIERRLILLLALAFLLVFGGAALLRGQIKANWLLPALVLLWPPRLPRIAAGTALVVTLMLSVAMVAVLHKPDFMDSIEQRVRSFADSYSLQAGERETRYPGIDTWSKRLREYQPVDGFATTLLASWQQASGQTAPPSWLVSDDYGLAAQVIFAWRQQRNNLPTRMVIPADGIFVGTMPAATTNELDGGVLILAVQQPPGEVWTRLPTPSPLLSLQHPATGAPVVIAISDGQLQRK